jgi:cytochrome P450 family 135
MAVPRGLPPGPRWPVALQTLRYGLDPYGLFESAHRAFGDVFTVRVMAETWVILAHPDAVRELFGHGPGDLDSGVANLSLRPLLGTRSVFLLDGDEHLRRRKLVLPPFHGQRMRAYEALIRETTRREIATWRPGAPVRTLPSMQAVTFQVILRAVFGVAEGPELDRLRVLLRRLLAWTTDPRRGLVFAFLGPDRLMGLRAYRRQLAELDGEIFAEIARRRTVPDLGDRQDILSLLLQARHEADAAITETLRLHPPVPLGAVRQLRRPMTVAGWKLPEGATVAPCTLLLHRRPDVYAQPTAWQVDRFLEARPPAGAWLPFGGGVRRCVGAAFAQFEARTVLDEVTRALELRPAGKPTRRIARRGIVLVPPRGGAVVAVPRVAC